MSSLIGVPDHIAQARKVEGLCPPLPWSSFADFFKSRVYDRALVNRTFLTYCDDDRAIRYTYSYGEFGTVVQSVATFLHDRVGLRRGDRLATILFNHDVTVVLYFAAWILGVTIVPINIEESTDKKRFILEHSEASAVCCWYRLLEEMKDLQRELPALRQVIALNDEGFVEGPKHRAKAEIGAVLSSLATSPHAPSLDDEALIVYTSGTTGMPKGVVLTVENLLLDADAIADWHQFGADDRLMCVLPIHHVYGTVVTLITPFYCKGSIILNRKFKSATFWRRLHEERVTCVSVVPTLLEFLLDANEDLTAYKLDSFGGFICGAGPLLTDTATRFEDRFGFPIRHGYGLSETTCYSCFLPNELSRDEHRRWIRDYEFPSIGVPLRHNKMAIFGGDGQLLPEMTRGEICIRGGNVCAGYFKRDDANDGAFQWGWFRSGDEGFYVRDKLGRPFFFISGRLKELIIRGGVNIAPLEIDGVLRSHPLVRFAMAVPFEHRYYGEEIAAYVVPRDGVSPPTEAEVLAHCRQRLPFSKCPKVIRFGQNVPYTSTGKPKRLELKISLASTLAVYRDYQFKDAQVVENGEGESTTNRRIWLC
ncbi:MAG: class I adenylate-forming enzyme family protein [Nitrospira sp.]